MIQWILTEVQGIQCIGTAERCSETDPRWFRVDTRGGTWGNSREDGGKDDTEKHGLKQHALFFPHVYSQFIAN